MNQIVTTHPSKNLLGWDTADHAAGRIEGQLAALIELSINTERRALRLALIGVQEEFEAYRKM